MAKIVLVANTDWYLYNFRLSLAQTLLGQGYEVLLVSPSGKYAPLLEEAGFRWLAWEVGRQSMAPWKELPAILSLYHIYRREQPDLVHHFTVKPVLYGALAAWLAGKAAVVNSITGLGYVFLGQETKARFLRHLVKMFYRQVLNRPHSGVIFENTNDRQFFIDQGLVAESQTWLIEGVGVDAERFHPSPEPEGQPVIVLPARLLWDKGVNELVEAARLLRPRVKARFVLVGEPDKGNPASVTESDIQKWVKEGVVEWWGWCNDMREVYAACHIVTLPSYGEGIPTTLLEAAASGRPVVATAVPGCQDVVVDGLNGYKVPVRDGHALAEALAKLVEDPALRVKMGAAGRQLVLEKYTSPQINAQNLNVYESLICRNSHAV
jgi:glycosyltransferase involved in cell wall biosynthesis